MTGFDTLTTQLTGRVLTPEAPDFAALATPWNLAPTPSTLAVVEVAGADDVAAVLRCAAAHGVEVAVRCTGHSAADRGRPTLVVHTGRLDELAISPDGSARVGAGVRWARVLEAAAPLGLAPLAGSAPNVGVVGYLTGGGLGPVARTFGYAADRVTALDVVTGDGELRRATATENPALFWGLRGGKGALGIVTAAEFDLVPLSEIYGGCLYFDGSDAVRVAHAWRRWCATLPEQATTSLALVRLPDLPGVPPPLAGRLTVAVRFAWVGEADAGEGAIAPLRRVAPVVLGAMRVLPYAKLGSIHTDRIDPARVQDRAVLLSELTARTLDDLLGLAGPAADCPQMMVELRLLGGAVARPTSPSAVSHRQAAFLLTTIGPAVPALADTVAAHAEIVMSAAGRHVIGAQPNFGWSTDPARVARNYEPAALARLGALAARYDPHGVLADSRVVRDACLTDRLSATR